jgi:hypothetical protein
MLNNNNEPVLYSERIKKLKNKHEELELKIYNNHFGLEYLSERQVKEILADLCSIEDEIKRCFSKQYPEKNIDELSKMMIFELTR